MPHCPECGALNSDSSSFCIRCGQSFTATAQPAPEPAVVAPDAGRILDEAAELYAGGKLDEAAAACRVALDHNPSHVAARSLLGMVEEDRGNLAAALAEYEAVIRLAPERTAERQRADDLRARVKSEAADTYADETPDRRRLMIMGGALAAGILVLIIGTFAFSGGRRGADPPPPGFAGMPGEPGEYGQGLEYGTPTHPAQGGVPSAMPPAAVSLGAGDGPLAGRGIGPSTTEPRDQSDHQPSQRAGTGSGGGGRTSSPPPIPSPLPLPPPTVERGSPLQLPPAPSPDQPSRDLTQPQPLRMPTPATPPAPSAAPAPPAEEPARGRVRIWMGEDADTPASGGPATGTPQPAPEPAAPATGTHHGRALPPGATAPTARASGTPVVGSAPGGGHAADRSAMLRPAPAPSGAGDRTTTRTQARPDRPGQGRPQPLTTPASTSASSRPATRTSGPSGESGARGVQVAPRSGASAAAPSSAPAPSAPASASDVRARAQQAQAAGRTNEARGLYRDAMQRYQADARSNPGRSAVNRSAVESIERALDALDAGR